MLVVFERCGCVFVTCDCSCVFVIVFLVVFVIVAVVAFVLEFVVRLFVLLYRGCASLVLYSVLFLWLHVVRFGWRLNTTRTRRRTKRRRRRRKAARIKSNNPHLTGTPKDSSTRTSLRFVAGTNPKELS